MDDLFDMHVWILIVIIIDLNHLRRVGSTEFNTDRKTVTLLL